MSLELRNTVDYHAPIVLFVYNRPRHTQATVEALLANSGASETELIIYCDGPKNKEMNEEIRAVRQYVQSVEGFASVKIIERSENLGLAESIISGVTETLRSYPSAIVLEDDILTSPYFIQFMNAALEKYKLEEKVWHVSGWNYPISTEGLEDVYFSRYMSCWGWATWADRWQYFERNPAMIVNTFTKPMIKAFTLDGVANTFWQQVQSNFEGKIKTWAIFWYATIFLHDGLCLNPVKSYVVNIGFDGSGTHCSGTYNPFSKNTLDGGNLPKISSELHESSIAVERVKDFYLKSRVSLFDRIVTKLLSIARLFLNPK